MSLQSSSGCFVGAQAKQENMHISRNSLCLLLSIVFTSAWLPRTSPSRSAHHKIVSGEAMGKDFQGGFGENENFSVPLANLSVTPIFCHPVFQGDWFLLLNCPNKLLLPDILGDYTMFKWPLLNVAWPPLQPEKNSRVGGGERWGKCPSGPPWKTAMCLSRATCFLITWN